MPDYTAEPQRYDTHVIVGDTWLLQLALADEDGAAISLAGATGAASIVAELGGPTIATPVVTVTSAVDGELTVTLAASTTVDLAPGTYRYAVRITWGDGTARTIVEGTATVRLTAIGA